MQSPLIFSRGLDPSGFLRDLNLSFTSFRMHTGSSTGRTVVPRQDALWLLDRTHTGSSSGRTLAPRQHFILKISSFLFNWGTLLASAVNIRTPSIFLNLSISHSH